MSFTAFFVSRIADSGRERRARIGDSGYIIIAEMSSDEKALHQTPQSLPDAA